MMTDKTQNSSWRTSVTADGSFNRRPSRFRNWITADGSSGFKAEANRYHIYICYACPWAHRTLIFRKLKGLEDVISVDVVDWMMTDKGWSFDENKAGCTKDTVNGCKYLREVYKKADPEYTGNITVPTLWDKQTRTVVNNESSEIIRMLNTEFNEFCLTEEQRNLSFYPEHLRTQIDEINSWVYNDINNGVYRTGFARSQKAYDEAVIALFAALDKVEVILAKQRYLVGSVLTEADVRLFTTLVRFDQVYHGHFKCNKKRLVDYPNLWAYTRELYQHGGIADTVNMEHIRYHYMASHESINPFRIISIGPELDFLEPHNRDKMTS